MAVHGVIDPAQEVFDLCDRDGRPTGQRKLRPLVHRDGDWHRSFHCWVVTRAGEGAGIVLQRRADRKETWGGLWDLSVGGHYSAGEGIEGGIREMSEELGLTVNVAELVHVGWRREEYVYPNGLIEREVQDVYFLRRDVGLDEIRTDPSEVSGAAIVPAEQLDQLASGQLSAITVPGGSVGVNGAIAVGAVTIASAELVPRSGRYYPKAARFARELMRGTAVVRRRRWW
jgi:isopentenyldiphosphate isomerase